MQHYFGFLKKRWHWASKGIFGLCGLASLVAGALMAAALWISPAWTHHNISEQTNAFVVGLVPLLVGGSVFLVRWILSPYFVWRAERQDFQELQQEMALLHEKRADFIYQGVGSQIRLSFRMNPRTNRRVARIDFALRFQNKGEGTAYQMAAKIYDCWINENPPRAALVDVVESSGGRTTANESKTLQFWAECPAREFNGRLGLNEKDVLIILVEIEFRLDATASVVEKNEPIWLTWDPRIDQRLSDAKTTEVQLAKEHIDRVKAEQS